MPDPEIAKLIAEAEQILRGRQPAPTRTLDEIRADVRKAEAMLLEIVASPAVSPADRIAAAAVLGGLLYLIDLPMTRDELHRSTKRQVPPPPKPPEAPKSQPRKAFWRRFLPWN